MAVFIVLWSYLLTLINKTTKLRSVIRHNLGHSIAPILFTNNAPIPSANEVIGCHTLEAQRKGVGPPIRVPPFLLQTKGFHLE